MLEVIAKEIRAYALIALELVFGVLSGILLIGLIPGDGLDFNVLGSLVVLAVTGGLYFLFSHLRKQYV